MRYSCCLLMLAASLVMASCIKNEPKNAEADIIRAYFAPEENIPDLGAPIITNNNVMMILPMGVDKHLPVMFQLTPGATIYPASGTVRDFSSPQIYTVTSQDGKWSKDYFVGVSFDMQLKYNFAHYDRDKYDIFYENVYGDNGIDVIGQQYIWASGNAALSFLLGSAPASDYATSAAEMIGPEGDMTHVAKLVTRSTGRWGAAAGMPIAAGNLFIGWFNSRNAMADPLGATEFGFPFNKKPKALKGWYRYTSGTKDHNGNVVFPPERPDSCHVYAVLYRSDNGERLNGSNILTSPSVVAKAILKAPPQTLEGQWKQFENNPGDGQIDFEYVAEVNEEDLAEYKYNLAVVFTSSKKGGEFKGAIGSELLIDDVEITVEE